MIWESHYWKDDLLKQAEELRLLRSKRRLGERSLAKVEQTLLLGFYSIRKLTEADMLSCTTVDQQVEVTSFPWAGKPVTKLNCHRIDELYNLEDGQLAQKPLRAICNQFIHSYVFTPCFDASERLNGILVTSDRARMQSLFLVSVIRVIELFEQAGRDYPNSSRTVFDPKIGDYRTQSVMLLDNDLEAAAAHRGGENLAANPAARGETTGGGNL